jgi:transposase
LNDTFSLSYSLSSTQFFIVRALFHFSAGRMRASTNHKAEDPLEERIARALIDHMSYADIKAQFHTSQRRIKRVSDSIQAGNGVPQPLKAGRPTKMTPEVIEHVQQSTVDDPYLGSHRLAEQIGRDLGVPISHETINRIRALLHYRYQVPSTRPLLSPLQIQNRLNFCEEALRGSINWGGDVIISDESRFGLYDDSRRLWVQRGIFREKASKAKPKFRKSFMCWAAIGKGYKSRLIFIDGNLDAKKYREMLETNHILEDIKAAVPADKVRFQQDGAPCHTAKATVKFIEKIVPVVKWPANSPDLSVIENLWAILKIKVIERAPKDMASLKAVLIEEWNAISQQTIDHLIESTPARFELCRQHNGDFIGHLLNQTQEKRRKLANRAIPDGFTIPSKVSINQTGQLLKVIGFVTRQWDSPCPPGPSSFKISNGRMYCIRLEDPKALIPEGRLPRHVDVTVGEEHGLFYCGMPACIEAHCFACAPSQIEWEGVPRRQASGRVLSFTVLLELKRLLPSDEHPDDLASCFEGVLEEEDAEEIPMREETVFQTPMPEETQV